MKWGAYPHTNEMTENERQHGNMQLTTWTAKRLARELYQDRHQCPTCNQEFLSNKALSHRRANKQPRNKQWKEEKPTRKICPEEMQRKFHTIQQLRIHMEQRNQEPNIPKHLYTLDPEGPIGRRKMIYQGAYS